VSAGDSALYKLAATYLLAAAVLLNNESRCKDVADRNMLALLKPGSL
jgi:hypothetical protein